MRFRSGFKISFTLLGFVFISFAGTSLATTASFQGLGDLAGGDFESVADGVSADGSTVVGNSKSTSGTEAFLWTLASGMVGLGDLAGGSFYSVAFNVSADGSTVVGQSFSASGPEAFCWTSASGMVGLGGCAAYGVSADGSTIVGEGGFASGMEAFRWTSASGMIGLGDLPGGIVSSRAFDVSADGSTVVGVGHSGWYYPSGSGEAFCWTPATGMVGLGRLPGGSLVSYALGISADGSTVVGSSGSGSGYEAFRWTSDGGMVGLGDLPGGSFSSSASDVSADGSIVVGRSESALGDEAFIWDNANGIKSLRDVLVNDYGLDLTGWTLSYAKGISDDGLTIAGYGINPNGYTEAWIATIPEPASAVLMIVGATIISLRRRK